MVHAVDALLYLGGRRPESEHTDSRERCYNETFESLYKTRNGN